MPFQQLGVWSRRLCVRVWVCGLLLAFGILESCGLYHQHAKLHDQRSRSTCCCTVIILQRLKPT